MSNSARVIQLRDFALLKVSLSAPQQREESFSSEGDLRLDFKFSVLKAKANQRQLILSAVFQSPFEKGKPMGLSGEAEIGGLFECPEGVQEKDREGMLLYNGALILYGLLRGQLAAVSGSFPRGKFMLPSLDMLALVRKWTEDKAKELERGKPAIQASTTEASTVPQKRATRTKKARKGES